MSALAPIPRTAGTWRHWCRMTRGRHEATVARRTADDGSPVYIVSLNGAARRSYTHWSDALAYAAHTLTITPEGV